MEKKCKNCGANLEENVKFCPKCGENVEREKKEMNVKSEKVVGTEKKGFAHMKAVVIIGVIVVIIIAGGIFLKTRPKVIDLNNYLNCKTSGYDGWGQVNVSLKEEKLAKDIYRQMNKKKSRFDEETLCDYLDFNIDVDVSKSEELSNGDKVKVTYEFKEDDLKDYGIKLKGKEKTIQIKDLEKVKKVDIFKDLKLEFNGVGPDITVEQEITVEVDGAYFTCDVAPSEGLNIGDTVTVTCLDTDMSNGIVPKESSTTVTVPDTVAHSILDPSELTVDDKNKFVDVINHVAAHEEPYKTPLNYDEIHGRTKSKGMIRDCTFSNISVANDLHFYVNDQEEVMDTWYEGDSVAVAYFEEDATINNSWSDYDGQTVHCYGYCIFYSVVKENGIIDLTNASMIGCKLFDEKDYMEEDLKDTLAETVTRRTEYVVTFDSSKEVEKVSK